MELGLGSHFTIVGKLFKYFFIEIDGLFQFSFCLLQVEGFFKHLTRCLLRREIIIQKEEA